MHNLDSCYRMVNIMSNFNKMEYNSSYNKNKTKLVTLRMSEHEYETFCEYCTNIGMQKATYLKMLVDNDAISKGYNAIFGKDKRFRKEND